MTQVIPAELVTILGTVAGRQYARLHDGQEVVVESEIQPWEESNKVPPHKLVITKNELFRTNEMAYPAYRTRQFLASPVEAGTFERRQAAGREAEQRRETQAAASQRLAEQAVERRAARRRPQ